MKPARRSLEYEQGRPGVTRGQFRLLLLLMLVQVVMTAQSNYAPGLIASVKSAWAERQATRQAAAAEKARQQQAAVLEQRCRTFTQPADKVVWEEDPQLAAPLLAGGGYEPVRVKDQFASPVLNFIPPEACAGLPSFMRRSAVGSAVPGGEVGVAFIHGRRSPGGAERLVVVWATGQTDLPDSMRDTPPPTKEPVDFKLPKFHGLEAKALQPDFEKPDPYAPAAEDTTLWLRAPDQPAEMPAHWAPPAVPGQPPTLRVDYRDQFRVYAGQADAADPAHFTIDYALDGRRGTIDGYLTDLGTVTLKPRQGAVVGKRWYRDAKEDRQPVL